MTRFPSIRFFLRFFIYDLLFFMLQLAIILTQTKHFTQDIPLPWIVCKILYLALLAHVSLYFIFALLQTSIYIRLPHRKPYLFFFWLISVIALLALNQYYFPLSRFSQYALLQTGLGHFILAAGLIICSLLFIGYRPVLFLSVLLLVYAKLPDQEILFHTPAKKPNIFLIGIDSVPPTQTQIMPNVNHFLEQGIYFPETISPEARTYPAWVSILTGLYPFHHHATYNLTAPENVASQKSLIYPLNHAGYQTIFATDDRQFNNLDRDFGFQKIVGPNRGAADLILGAFNDFPLSNLVINFSWGQWLFPHNYANRASFYTYLPQTFNQELNESIQTLDHEKPIFMAVHFTLPHWPYSYAQSKPQKHHNEFNNKIDVTYRAKLYQKALIAADNQVAQWIITLKKSNLLENSLVVIFSDHGETLYVPGSRLLSMKNYTGKQPSPLATYFKQHTQTKLNKSAGHGSDLLSPLQYHCIFGLQYYRHNLAMLEPKKILTPVALIDFAPTLINFAKIVPFSKQDGISLWPAIIKNNIPLPQRSFILESGMLPNQFLSEKKAQFVAKHYFIINQHSGLFTLRNDTLHELDHLKLYALLTPEWIFALYPLNDHYIPVLQSRLTEHWTDDLHTPLAHDAKADEMLAHLTAFYHRDFSLM